MPEFELRSISVRTRGSKEVPQRTFVELRLGSRAGAVGVRVKLPGQVGWSDYPDLPIQGGEIHLPVRVAFLSHAHEDKEFVGTLEPRLREIGVLTWFDKNDLLPGDDWKRKIDEAIETSDFVLVFLSSASVAKTGYFQRELKYALEQRDRRPEGTRYIIPVLIDDCDPPGSLRDIHWLRVSEPDWYEKLSRALLA